MADSTSAASGPGPASRRPLVFAFAAAAVALLYAAVTGHMWEDYFITFRASLNLATGHGLVFQPGERVHSFTSPLGTLLPALFALGGGADVAVRALWLFRGVSALALGGALWLAVRAWQRDGLAGLAVTAAAVAWICDAKTVDFATNGMETALVVFFVTWTWQAFSAGARLWPCALACAGLQWTRPDGFVFYAVIAGAWLVFGAGREGRSWPDRIAFLARATGLGVVLYLPWFIWAWSYYGSPIPHTILAKSGILGPREIAQLLAAYPFRLLVGQTALHDIFLPAYHFFGGWPDALYVLSRVTVTGAALAWLWPRVAPGGRIASAAFFLGGFYVCYIPPFAWYFPGWQALALVSWAYLLQALGQVKPAGCRAASLLPSALRTGTLLLVTIQVAVFGCVAWQMRRQQDLIENRHRAEVGRWLRQQAGARDTVFLECLGYIGYYSGLKMLDHPGLAAPEVVAARRAGLREWAQIIEKLQPTWIVLRPTEAKKVFGDLPSLRQHYTLRRTFDTRAALDAEPVLPGRGYLNFDAIFLVYRRTPTAAP
jgi:hypothetical protein